MKRTNEIKAIGFAFLAAVFYALNVPCSKILLKNTEPTVLAGFLYLGAGIGVGALYLLGGKKRESEQGLDRKDLPYVVGMIVLDIAAPILLMWGIKYGSSANASLLGNFEIAATTVIALVIFKEAVSKRLWAAIGLITLSSIILSFEGTGSFSFSVGSLLVISSTVCWGFENNCTRNISSKNTYEIVFLKGVFSGLGSLAIAFVKGESLPAFRFIAAAMILGFVAYGLSIFMYIKAQNTLGAAKTSAYYAAAPFVGVFFSFVFLREKLTAVYTLAFAVMAAGAILVVMDTLIKNHVHAHRHIITHTHNGSTHTHVITHSHSHNHYVSEDKHSHRHTKAELERELRAAHI